MATAAGPNAPYSGSYTLIVDETNVYWLAQASSDLIYKAPIAGGPAVLLASGHPGANDLAVDDTYVYWVSQGDGTLNKVHK